MHGPGAHATELLMGIGIGLSRERFTLNFTTTGFVSLLEIDRVAAG